MAEKRKFDSEYFKSDKFTSLSKEAQLLFFHMVFSAGDNGLILGVRAMCKMLDIELSALDELKRKHFVSDLPSDEFGHIKISTWSDVLGKKERNTFANEEWKKKVKTRDGNICVKCGSRENLHVHHILAYSKYPEMRYDVDNGITLCKDCHLKEHKGDWHNV